MFMSFKKKTGAFDGFVYSVLFSSVLLFLIMCIASFKSDELKRNELEKESQVGKITPLGSVLFQPYTKKLNMKLESQYEILETSEKNIADKFHLYDSVSYYGGKVFEILILEEIVALRKEIKGLREELEKRTDKNGW